MRARLALCLLALAALVPATAARASDPYWEEIEQHGDVPEPIWEAGVSYARKGGDPDVVFRFGGQRGDFPEDFTRNDFYALDLDTATWTDLAGPETPAPRADVMMVPGPCGNCVSVVGGRGRFRTGSDLMFPEMWTYHLNSHHWDEVSGGHLGDPFAIRRSSALVVAVPDGCHPNKKLFYAFGGVGNTLPAFPTTPGGLRNDVAVFKKPSGWTEVPTFGEAPPPLAWVSGAFDPSGFSLLVFGGYRLGEDQGPATPSSELFGPTNYENDLWSLDLATFVWTELEPYGPLPSPRDNVAAFFDAGRGGLVIFGGGGFDGTRNDLWYYSVADNRWYEIALAPGSPVPPGRVGAVHWVRETPTAYELWLHSGATFDGGASVLLDDLWKLTWPKQ